MRTADLHKNKTITFTNQQRLFQKYLFQQAIKLNDFRQPFLSTVLVDASSWKLFLLAHEENNAL